MIGAVALSVAVVFGGAAFWKNQQAKLEDDRVAKERIQKEETIRAEAAQMQKLSDGRAQEAQAALDAKQKQVDELAHQLSQTKSDLEQKTLEQKAGESSTIAASVGSTSAMTKAYHAIPVAQATPFINTMLKAVSRNDGVAILDAAMAIEDLKKPDRGDRKQARALNDEGLRLLKSNDWQQAEAAFLRAAEWDPMDREIAGNLGFAYDKMARIDDARVANMTAITIAPNQTTGWGGLGLALAKAGRQDEAIAAFRLAYRFSKNQAKTAEHFRKLAEADTDQKVREAAGKALTFMASGSVN